MPPHSSTRKRPPRSGLVQIAISLKISRQGVLSVIVSASGTILGYLICQLSAEDFFLLNIFFGEGGCEVFGFEDLADLYVAVA